MVVMDGNSSNAVSTQNDSLEYSVSVDVTPKSTYVSETTSENRCNDSKHSKKNGEIPIDNTPPSSSTQKVAFKETSDVITENVGEIKIPLKLAKKTNSRKVMIRENENNDGSDLGFDTQQPSSVLVHTGEKNVCPSAAVSDEWSVAGVTISTRDSLYNADQSQHMSENDDGLDRSLYDQPTVSTLSTSSYYTRLQQRLKQDHFIRNRLKNTLSQNGNNVIDLDASIVDAPIRGENIVDLDDTIATSVQSFPSKSIRPTPTSTSSVESLATQESSVEGENIKMRTAENPCKDRRSLIVIFSSIIAIIAMTAAVILVLNRKGIFNNAPTQSGNSSNSPFVVPMTPFIFVMETESTVNSILLPITTAHLRPIMEKKIEGFSNIKLDILNQRIPRRLLQSETTRRFSFEGGIEVTNLEYATKTTKSVIDDILNEAFTEPEIDNLLLNINEGGIPCSSLSVLNRFGYSIGSSTYTSFP